MSPLNINSLYANILTELEVKLKELILASAKHISPEGIVSTAAKDFTIVVDHLKGSILYNGGKASNIGEVLQAAQALGVLISGLKPAEAPKVEVPVALPTEPLKIDSKAPTVLVEKPKEFLPNILQ